MYNPKIQFDMQLPPPVFLGCFRHLPLMPYLCGTPTTYRRANFISNFNDQLLKILKLTLPDPPARNTIDTITVTVTKG